MSSTEFTKAREEDREKIIKENKDFFKAIYIVPSDEMIEESEYGYYVTDEDEKVTIQSVDDKLYSYEDAKIKCGILYSNMRLKEGEEIMNKIITSIPGLQYKVINTYFEEDPSAFLKETIMSKDITTDFTNVYIQSILNTNNVEVEDISIEWFGYIVPEKTETWTFEIQSDRASYLWVGDHALYEYSPERANIKTPAITSDISVMTYQVELQANDVVPFRMQFGNTYDKCTFNVSIRTSSNNNMNELMDNFTLYMKNNDVYELRRIFYCLKKNMQSNKENPRDWKVIGDMYTPIRRNENGQIECMGNNGRDCAWTNSNREANNLIFNPVQPNRPVICSVSEYNNANHWCSRANKVIPQLSTQDDNALYNLFVLDTEDPDTMNFIKMKNRNETGKASQKVKAKVAWSAFDPVTNSGLINKSNSVLLSGYGVLGITNNNNINNLSLLLANLDFAGKKLQKTSCALKFDVVGNKVELNLYYVKKPIPPPPPPPPPPPIIKCKYIDPYLYCEARQGSRTASLITYDFDKIMALSRYIEKFTTYTDYKNDKNIKEGATDSIQIDRETNIQYPISGTNTYEYRNQEQYAIYEEVKKDPCKYTLTQRDVRCLISKYPELYVQYKYRYGSINTLANWNDFWKKAICKNSKYNDFTCPSATINGQLRGYSNDRKPKRPPRINAFPSADFIKGATIFSGEFPDAVPSLRLQNSNNNIFMFCEDLTDPNPKTILKIDTVSKEIDTEFILKSEDNRFCLKFDKNGNLVIVYYVDIERNSSVSKKGKPFIYTRDKIEPQDYGTTTSFYFYKILPNTPIMGRTLYLDMKRDMTSFIGSNMVNPIDAFITAGDFYPQDQTTNIKEFPVRNYEECEKKCLSDKNCSSYYQYKIDDNKYCKYNSKEIMDNPQSLYNYKSSALNITDSVLKLRKSDLSYNLHEMGYKIPFQYYLTLEDVKNSRIPPLNYRYLASNNFNYNFIGVASLEEMMKWRKDGCILLYGENNSNCNIYNTEDLTSKLMEPFSKYQEGFGSNYGYDANGCQSDPNGCKNNFLNRKIPALEKMNREFAESQNRVNQNVHEIKSKYNELMSLDTVLRGNPKYEYDKLHEIKINKINIEDVAAKDAKDLMQTHNLTYAFGTLASISLVVAAVYLSRE